MIVIIFLTIILTIFINLTKNIKGKMIVNSKLIRIANREKIGVYIDGEVNLPGYIVMSKGSTLKDALNKVNGITKNADIDNIDINRKIKNGEKLIIPKKKEINDIYTIDDDLQDAININKASLEELKLLDGIGEKTAQKIIEYRNKKRFQSIEEIMMIKGIGENKFEKIKNKITV